MATVELDARGMKCPLPVLKMNSIVFGKKVNPGDILAVIADCPSFEHDLRDWCGRTKKVLVVLRDVGGGVKRAEVRI
jgi:tRNA 2-thiouridine synthesizing protein A